MSALTAIVVLKYRTLTDTRYGSAGVISRRILQIGGLTAIGSYSAYAAGWKSYPDSKLRAVCPRTTTEYPYRHRCHNLRNASGGVTSHTNRNRLIVLGGRNRKYRGNELRGINLNKPDVQRLSDPERTRDSGRTRCRGKRRLKQPTEVSVGQGTVYLPQVDRLFVFDRNGNCRRSKRAGYTWLSNFNRKKWRIMSPSGVHPPAAVLAAVFDPETQFVFARTGMALYRYDIRRIRWTKLSRAFIPEFRYHSLAIDTAQRLLVLTSGPSSGNVYTTDLNDPRYPTTILDTTGGARLAAQALSAQEIQDLPAIRFPWTSHT